MQKVAAAMHAARTAEAVGQENVSPDSAHSGRQDAILRLFPPTPLGIAPMQAAAASVAAKHTVPRDHAWSAPTSGTP